MASANLVPASGHIPMAEDWTGRPETNASLGGMPLSITPTTQPEACLFRNLTTGIGLARIADRFQKETRKKNDE